MSVRSLFTLLFTVSLGVTFLFIYFTLQIVWLLLGSALPDSTSVLGYSFPTLFIIVLAGVFLFFLLLFLFSILYLLIDRLIVQPIKIIADAMHEFAEHSHQVELPPFSSTTNEVKWLSTVFTEFTGSVERVHNRDMEVSRMKSDFISTAAHQLRTPMTGIRWALEALQKSGLTPDQQTLVDSATSKSKDLVGIVGTLLDISAIESGKYVYKFVPTDIETLVQDITQEFSVMASTRKVSLFFAKSGEAIPKVQADSERIKWVLSNLIENAIRYTPAEGSVQLSVTTGMGRVIVRVKDTGIGIKEEDKSSIFERFYRAQNAIEKEQAGNGLGLYIARTIAKDHGGDLMFESNKTGPGTTFTFSLAIAR